MPGSQAQKAVKHRPGERHQGQGEGQRARTEGHHLAGGEDAGELLPGSRHREATAERWHVLGGTAARQRRLAGWEPVRTGSNRIQPDRTGRNRFRCQPDWTSRNWFWLMSTEWNQFYPVIIALSFIYLFVKPLMTYFMSLHGVDSCVCCVFSWSLCHNRTRLSDADWGVLSHVSHTSRGDRHLFPTRGTLAASSSSCCLTFLWPIL